ncbi:hypothetical protein [Persicitalea jodogahamensis]|uniref:Lipoprotein n=1 Tax=Persicitalea jodogahamensis TaxID=402147 RepID=A0A8J3D566_9BACT|nr:hypothetical protein [Persicitalea jodogahamensis]GHB54707.1 hypothetical protein GCM10007390_04760 [Persicitalea jodogahamensis]
MRIFVLLFLLAFAAGCNQTQKKTESSEKRVVVNDTIPSERTNVDPKPVATYSKSVPDALNQFKFTVKLYETPLRFRYRVAVTYKMLEVKDSVDIPNFGYQPKVDVRRYENDLSAMIGFYDAKGTFMDLKKVEVVGNQLKMRQVKRYGVGTVRKK